MVSHSKVEAETEKGQVSCLISLEWVAISRSRDLHDPRIEPASLHLLHWAGRLFTTGAT